MCVCCVVFENGYFGAAFQVRHHSPTEALLKTLKDVVMKNMIAGSSVGRFVSLGVFSPWLFSTTVVG